MWLLYCGVEESHKNQAQPLILVWKKLLVNLQVAVFCVSLISRLLSWCL